MSSSLQPTIKPLENNDENLLSLASPEEKTEILASDLPKEDLKQPLKLSSKKPDDLPKEYSKKPSDRISNTIRNPEPSLYQPPKNDDLPKEDSKIQLPMKASDISQIPPNLEASLSQPSKTLENASIYFPNKTSQNQIIDPNMRRVLKAITVFLVGDDKYLSIPRTKFLNNFIPETYMMSLRESFPDKINNDSVFLEASEDYYFKFISKYEARMKNLPKKKSKPQEKKPIKQEQEDEDNNKKSFRKNNKTSTKAKKIIQKKTQSIKPKLKESPEIQGIGENDEISQNNLENDQETFETEVDKKRLLLAIPVKHSFSRELQIIFMLEPIGDQLVDNEDGAVMWFCESNNLTSLDYLKAQYQKHISSRSILTNLPNMCMICYENEQSINADSETIENFAKELEEFSKLLKTNTFKFPLKSSKNLYEKLRKHVTKHFSELFKEIKEKMIKLRETVNPNPKLEKYLLNDLAMYFIQNQGYITQNILESKVYLMLGRPNDIMFSQFKKALEPYIRNIKSLKYLSIRKNPIIDEKTANGKFIFTESEANDLVKLYWEYFHFNNLKNHNKKQGILTVNLRNPSKESKNPMHVNIDSVFKAILGFPAAENYQELKDFLEKNMQKIKETYSQDYEEILHKRHKAPKPKPNYKTFDPLKRDFHGQEISKLVSKEFLNGLAEFLIRNNPLEEPDPQNLKLFTGFIGLKETKHLTKRLIRITQEINEQKNKQKTPNNVVEAIKEKFKNEEILRNLRNNGNYEDWGLIYLKSCKSSNEAIETFKSKNPTLTKKIALGGFKKIIRMNLLGYEENDNLFLAKGKKLKKMFLLISDETPSNVEVLRKLLDRELLLPKKSRSLLKIQLLIVFFTSPNSPFFENFETWVRKSSENINVTLLEEQQMTMKTFFEFQFFSKLTKFYEKQAIKPKELEVSKPDLQGIIAPITPKNPSITYDKFIELLNSRLFPGESLNRELMDELFRNWFLKNEKIFDVVDFNKLYEKALRKISRLIEMIYGKIETLKIKQRELANSLDRNEEFASHEEFLAVKIEEFIGINENLLKKNKKNNPMNNLIEVTYAGENLISNKFSLIKSLKINEKFLLQYIINENFIIRLRHIDDKNPLDNLSFSIVLKDLKPEEFMLGTIKEVILNAESTDLELSRISLKLRYKRLVYSHEKASIKLRKYDDVLKNLNDYLTLVYRYKYELLEAFAPKSTENSVFLNNHIGFLENLNAKKPQEIQEIPVYDEEIDAINQELDRQKAQIKLLENLKSTDNKQKDDLEAEIKQLKESLKNLKESDEQQREKLEQEITRKSKNFDEIIKNQGLNNKKLELLSQALVDIQKKLSVKEKDKQVIIDKRSEIVAFFTFGKNQGIPDESLRKLQEYFLYVQKSIIKFYNKAVIIEADVFEMKASTLKAGLGCLAGSVPFIGNLLKFVVETLVEAKKKWDEHKFVRKCLKFSTLIHSQRILAEVTEETAFEIIKDPKKQAIILEASEIKSSTMEKLKEKLMEFFKKTKEFFLGKKKNKTQEKLLKDLDTPAKLLGNIDGGYLCTQAVELYKEEHMEFDPTDPYNKKGLIKLFRSILLGIDSKIYEKVIGFEEMKDFKGILEYNEESLKEKVGVLPAEFPTHEEIKILTLEDVATQRKIEEANEEIAYFRDRQDKNEKKLRELIEEHNIQNQDLEAHEKRLNALEKQAVLGLNYLGGLNQEVSDLNERVENLYTSMNIKYQEILKKVEEGKIDDNNLEGSGVLKRLSKQSTSEKILENDPFFMYLEKNSAKLSGMRTPSKQLLTPLKKKQ